MAKFKSVSVKMLLKIEAAYAEDIDKGVHRYMDSFLMKYSTRLNGILVSYIVSAISNRGMLVNGSPDVVLLADIELLVLEVLVNSKFSAANGLALGTFRSRVDGEDNFSGEFAVKRLSISKNGMTIIEGSKVDADVEKEVI